MPVPYFHVVFTLPAQIADIAYQNKAVIYDLLFKASAETMITIAADPKHLGARIGILSVLHTWGSALTHHPHVHMIVPGGGISLDGERWIACRPTSSCPCACSRACSAGGSWTSLMPLITPDSYSSSASTSPWPMHKPLPPIWLRCATANGSSTQTAIRRPRGSAALSRPLHTSRRYLQSPPGRGRREQRHLQIEGLSDRRSRSLQV